MISSTCKSCFTTHSSDEAHVGKFLKCAGCGKPVLIEAKADIEIPSPTQYQVKERHKQKSAGFFNRYKLVGLAAAVLGLAIFLAGRYSRTPESQVASKSESGTLPTPQPLSSSPIAPPSTANDLGFRPAPVTTTGPPWATAGPDVPYVAKAAHSGHSKHDIFDDAGATPPNSRTPSKPAKSSAQEIGPYNPTHLNGERLDDESQSGGHGKFDVSNHKNLDAVVIMIDPASKTTSAKLYLQRYGDGQINKISPGSYEVHITEGLDWDDSLGQFRTDPAYFKLPTPITFDEHDSGTQIVFHHISITLHTVLNGNLKQVAISKGDFWPRGIPERVR